MLEDVEIVEEGTKPHPLVPIMDFVGLVLTVAAQSILVWLLWGSLWQHLIPSLPNLSLWYSFLLIVSIRLFHIILKPYKR